jgi:hypothetical protein
MLPTGKTSGETETRLNVIPVMFGTESGGFNIRLYVRPITNDCDGHRTSIAIYSRRGASRVWLTASFARFVRKIMFAGMG